MSSDNFKDCQRRYCETTATKPTGLITDNDTDAKTDHSEIETSNNPVKTNNCLPIALHWLEDDKNQPYVLD